MKQSIVTIFGASGLLGRNAVRLLADGGLGYRIRAAVRHPNLANFLLPMGHVGQIQLLKCDVTRADTIAPAVRGATAVVNLVGILHPSGGHQKFEAVHVDAAQAIARAAKAAGARALVHVSALGADPDSDSAYARTKAEGERRVREAFPAASILRPSLVFGPEDNFFNRFAAMARLSPLLPLIGGGKTKFQPVFAGDVAAAIKTCIENPDCAGKTYELGGPGIYSFRELMQVILRETGRHNLLIPVPFFAATIMSWFLGLLPNPLLTPDQVRLLRKDNVVAPGALTFADLGIRPDAVEAIVPSYLWRFRRKGQYEAIAL